MPYAPTVNDMSGQIYAQGIGQGINALTAMIQQSEQNKEFAAKSKAIENLLKTHASDFGISDDQTNLMLSPNPQENGLQRYSRLSTFLQGAVEAQKAKAQQMQLQQAQREMAMQQQAMNRLDAYANARPGITPVSIMQAAQDPMAQFAVKTRQLTGQLPNPSILEKFATMNKMAPQEINTSTGAKALFSPSTGAFSVLPKTAQEEGNIEAAKAEAELTSKDAIKTLADVSDSAETARNTLGSVQRVLSLYDQGAQSGFGQPVLTTARNALARLGLGKDGLANQQQFENELATLVVSRRRELMKGTGAVSDYETRMVERAMANPSLTPQANRQILDVMQKISERSVKLDELRNRMEDEGKTNVEIARAVRKTRDSLPVGIDSLAALATQSTQPTGSSTAMKQVVPKGIDPKLWAVMTPEEKALWK